MTSKDKKLLLVAGVGAVAVWYFFLRNKGTYVTNPYTGQQTYVPGGATSQYSTYPTAYQPTNQTAQIIQASTPLLSNLANSLSNMFTKPPVQTVAAPTYTAPAINTTLTQPIHLT
jgi:hypothetical protein